MYGKTTVKNYNLWEYWKKKTSIFPETSSPLEISSDATKAGFMHDFSLQLILKSYNNFFKKGC